MNENVITVIGNVVNDPDLRSTKAGMPFVAFRVASTPRWFNGARGAWESGPTNFYSVTAFRALAANANASLKKGQPVVVHGRLRVNTFERADKTWGTRVEIDAMSIGHDLSLGVADFHKGTAALPDDHDRLGEDSVQSALAATEQGYDVVDPVTGELGPLTEPPRDADRGEVQEPALEPA